MVKRLLLYAKAHAWAVTAQFRRRKQLKYALLINSTPANHAEEYLSQKNSSRLKRVLITLSKIKVYTDGASRGNPGESGIGIIIYDSTGAVLKTWNEYTGKSTNNQAEYNALLKSLELIKELKQNHEITFIEFYADSQLMVRQINLEYKVKDAGLVPLFKKAQAELNSLKIPHTIKHIERKLNKEADKLANMGIDNRHSL